MSRNADRVAEELRILRAAKDGRLYLNEAGRWLIADEPRPDPKARRYLVQSGRVHSAWRWRETSITDKGRAMLADHEGSSA